MDWKKQTGKKYELMSHSKEKKKDEQVKDGMKIFDSMTETARW